MVTTALPTAASVFVIAQRYGVLERQAAAIIFGSHLVGIVTLTAARAAAALVARSWNFQEETMEDSWHAIGSVQDVLAAGSKSGHGQFLGYNTIRNRCAGLEHAGSIPGDRWIDDGSESIRITELPGETGSALTAMHTIH